MWQIGAVQIFITRGEDSSGPYSLEQVQDYLSQGMLLPDDLAYHEGLKGWIRLEQLIAEATPLEELPHPALLAQASSQVEPEVTTPKPSSAPVKGKIKLIIAAVVGLLVLSGLSVGVWILLKEGPDKQAQKQPSANKPSPPAKIPGAEPGLPPSPTLNPSNPEPEKPGTVLWEFETGGGVESSPAIGSDGTVYIGSQDCKLYALNGKNGAKKWEFETGQPISSSPALGADGAVYIGSNDNRVYAINLDGAKKWNFKTGSAVTAPPAIGSDDTVYIGSWDEKLYKINMKTGAKIWEFETDGIMRSTPALGANDTVYVGSGDGKVYALEGKTGAKKWEFVSSRGDIMSSIAIGSNNTLYLGESGGFKSGRFKIYALDVKGGAKKWEFETGGLVESSPAIGSDGTVYVGSHDKKIYALNGKNGAKKWEFETEGYVQSSPAIGADGTIYVGSCDKKVYALNGKTGAKIWEFETGHQVLSSPALSTDGILYVGSMDKKVYAIKTESLGPAKSPWPMRGQNPQHTGRAIGVSPTQPTEPEPEPELKLTPKEAAGLFADDIGKWKITGKNMPAGSDSEPFEDTIEIRWKVEGKSTVATFSVLINGGRVPFVGHKEYDAKEGVFIWRSKGEGLPETVSREHYDPATKTYRGKSTHPEGAEETSTFEIVSKDKRLFTAQVEVDGKVAFSREAVFTRIDESKPTEPKTNTPTKPGLPLPPPPTEPSKLKK